MADQEILTDRLIDCILVILAKDRFSTDDGKTFFQGSSYSALVDDLRDRGYTIYRDFDTMLTKTGFRIIRARPKMAHSRNPSACRAPCLCVTV